MLPVLPKFEDAGGPTGRRRLSEVVTLDALGALQTETMNIQIRVMVVCYRLDRSLCIFSVQRNRTPLFDQPVRLQTVP